MKKIYTIAIAFALVSSSVFAQSANNEVETLLENKTPYVAVTDITAAKEINDYQKDLQVDLWTDDFSDPDTWTVAHGENDADFDWEVGVGLTNQGDYPSGPITSTTADNGYAMLDSDYWGASSGGANENCWLTTADSIDLSDDQFVVLEFESYYRAFNTDACYVVISTNNTDWPTLDYDFDASTNDNVWQIHSELGSNDGSLNPETVRLNISEAAGNQEKVWIRFNWTGVYGYTWFVDDVKIVELPDNDMMLNYGVIAHAATGDEYGRVPESQLNSTMSFSALSSNIGGAEQTDVIIDIVVVDSDDNEIFNVSSSAENVAQTDSLTYETAQDEEFVEGLYTTTFTVTSAEEMDGDNFENNVEVRNFEITTDMYSLDGIGVHETAILSSLGTNSWAEESADGFMMMTWYEINEDESAIYGVEFLITTTTVPGGSVIVHLLDTADVLFEDGVVDNPIASSDEVTVTQEHVDAGVIRIYFDDAEMLDAGAYYASVEMYSEDNEYDIRILDDVTVPQPAMSSAIWYPGGDSPQIYSNGNAAAVRLLTMPANSVEEISEIAVLDQNHPNPAKDFTTISFELLDNQEVTVRLTDMLGKVVAEQNLGSLNPGIHKHTFDVNGLKAGTYHYSIVTDNGSLSKSMQVIR